VVVAGIVYFGGNDTFIYALNNHTGQTKWKVKTGFAGTSSPVLAEGVVYVGSDNTALYALRNGNLITCAFDMQIPGGFSDEMHKLFTAHSLAARWAGSCGNLRPGEILELRR
jgi:hypothetical protein